MTTGPLPTEDRSYVHLSTLMEQAEANPDLLVCYDDDDRALRALFVKLAWSKKTVVLELRQEICLSLCELTKEMWQIQKPYRQDTAAEIWWVVWIYGPIFCQFDGSTEEAALAHARAGISMIVERSQRRKDG